jgi:hypothetical protein
MSLPSTAWMALNASPGFALPATSVEFKVPIITTPTEAPVAGQVGYTLTGTTAEVAPIELASGVGSTLRSVSLTKGTWLLTANVNAEAQDAAIDLSKWVLGFVSSAGNHDVVKSGSELSGTGIVAGEYYGECISSIYQVATTTTVDLDLTATFTTVGGKFVVSNTDDLYIKMTATQLS